MIFRIWLACLLDDIERRTWGTNGSGRIPSFAHWAKFALLPPAGTWGGALRLAQGLPEWEEPCDFDLSVDDPY